MTASKKQSINWSIIFQLSLFGVVVGVAGLEGFPSGSEALLWLLIFILYALILGRNISGKYFLHAFLISVINGCWIGAIHSIFYSRYLQNNAEQLHVYNSLPMPIPPEYMMLIVGPIIGAITGIVAGVFAMIGGRLLRAKSVAPAETVPVQQERQEVDDESAAPRGTAKIDSIKKSPL